TNPNPGTPLTGVAFTDPLPAGLVVATPNGLMGTCDSGTITATAGSGSIMLAGAMLAANASCMFSVNVTGTSPGEKDNSLTVTSNEAGPSNPSTASLLVVLAQSDMPFQVRYATNLPLGDAQIYMTNTGANATTLCANVYGFTPDERLVACCSCLVTPNGLAALSVWGDLLSDVPPALPRPNALVLKLLAAPGTPASSCAAGVAGDSAPP